MPKEKLDLKKDFIEYTEMMKSLIEKADKNLLKSDAEKSYVGVYKEIYKNTIFDTLNTTITIDNGSHFIDSIYSLGTQESIEELVTSIFEMDPAEKNNLFSLPKEEQIKTLNQKFSDKIQNQESLSHIYGTVYHFVSSLSIYEKGFQEKFIDTLKRTTGASYEEILSDRLRYSNPYDLSPEENDYYPETGLIDEAIKDVNLNNNENLINDKGVILNALEESKQILSKANSLSKNIGSDVAEGVGVYYEKLFKKKLLEDYEKDPLTRGKFEDPIRAALKRGVSLEQTINIHKELTKHTLKGCFSEDQIRGFENLYKLMDRSNFIPPSMLEQGIKNYCFEPLYVTKDNLLNAIKNRNYDDVVKYTNEYKLEEPVLDEMLAQVKEINSEGRLISNLSVSRNVAMPFKYRKDFVNASNLNGISFVFRCLKDNNISVRDFLENPIEQYLKISQNFIDVQPPVNDIKNLSKGQLLLNSLGAYNLYEGVENLEFKAFSSLPFYRAFNTISSFIQDETKRREFTKKMNLCIDISTQQFMDSYLNASQSLFTGSLNDSEMAKVTKLVALLSYQPDVDSLLDISVQIDKKYDRHSFKEIPQFNLEDRVQRIRNIPNFLLETVDAQKFLKDHHVNNADLQNLVSAFRLLDNEIPADRKSPTYLQISNLVRSNHFNDIKTSDIENLKAEANFENLRKNGFSREGFAEGLLNAAKLKKTYENVGFFEKIINFSISQKNAISEDMVNKLAESGGLTKDEINNAVNLINSGLDNAIDIIKPNIKINEPAVNAKYVEQKLKGATEKELQILFESPLLLDEEARAKYEADLDLEESVIRGRIFVLNDEITKNSEFASSTDEYDNEAIKQYNNVSLEKAIINKKLGIETNFDDYLFPLTPEERKKYDDVVLGEKTNKRNDLANKKFLCSGKENNKPVEKTLSEIYNEICKTNSIDNSSLRKKPYDKVLSSIENDKNLLANLVGLNDKDTERFVISLKNLKAFDESIAKDKNNASVLTSKQSNLLNKIGDTKGYAEEKEAASKKIGPLKEARDNNFNQLNVVQEKRAKLNNLKDLIQNLDNRKAINGDEIENDLVAEYQRKLIAFNKLSPEQKEMYKAAGDELKAYKNSFKILNVNTDGFKFTTKEQQIYSANKNKVVELHNSKKAYESTSIVARFFSHFVPASWTDLGNARIQIENKQKEINDLGLSNEVIKHYESAIELENKANNNVVAENNKPVNANQEQKEIHKNRVIFNGEIDLKFSDSSYIEKTSEENKTLSSNKENKF